MIVDGSYTAWARPTRRVHFALSVGMTLTGVILIAAGASGGRGAVRPAPMIGRTADSVVSGGVTTYGTPFGTSGPIPAAPLVRFAPPAPELPLTSTPVTSTPKPDAKADVKPDAKPDARPHTKPKPHPRHAPHPSDVSHPQWRPAPRALPHPLPRPAAPMPPESPASLPTHPFTR